MSDIQDFILAHAAAPYDPAKAREYYLKTRELKGRSPGQSKTSSGGRTAQPKKVAQQRQAASNAKAIASIQKKIGALKSRLQELLKKVKSDKAKTANDKTKEGSGKSRAEGDEKLTAKQKSDQAKRSKESYEKNKEPAKAKTVADKDPAEEIKEIRAKITKMQAELKAAIAKARKK